MKKTSLFKLRKAYSLFLTVVIVLFGLISPNSRLAVYIHSNTNVVQAAGTGRLLGYEQTYNADRSASTTLVSIDQSTGTLTPLGQTLESSVTGTTQFDLNRATIDPIGHRIFFLGENINGDYMQNDIVVQNAQTGAILSQIPVSLDLINSGIRLFYEPSTINTPPTVNQLTNATLTEGSAYTVNSSFSDPDSTSWIATVNYGDGSGVNPLMLSGMSFSLSHVYKTLGTYTITVSITDNQSATGTAAALITVIPTGSLAGANLSHTNYTGGNFVDQDMTKANLSVAVFDNVNFTSANLTQVNGSNSSFVNANFTGANLSKINLSNSNLAGANFTNANLQGANLSGTTITGVTWSSTICPNGQSSNNYNNSCIGQGGGL